MVVRWFGILLAIALGLFPPAAGAQERITRFVSDVVVEADGTLDVTETIEVVATGQTIRRGIIRDVRTSFRNATGRRVVARITPVEVLREGNPEPYQTWEDGNGLHIRIGVAARTLPPGPHSYLIRYRATRLIGVFADYDELYWNATGNGWSLPIDEAEARITLPEGVTLGNRAVYTGRAGSRAGDAAVVQERPGQIVFRTTRPLRAAEGLTVAVAWPKGVVNAPPPGFLEWLGIWAPPVVAWLGSLGLLAAAVWLWWDDRRWRASIQPSAEPPAGLSAAATGYLWRMDFSRHLFAAALVEAATRDNLTIGTAKGELLETPRAQTLVKGDVEAAAGEAEGAMLQRLFERSREVEIGTSGQRALLEARIVLQRRLKSSYSGLFRLRFDRIWRFLALILLLELSIATFVPSRAEPVLMLIAWLSWLAGWLGLGWRERAAPVKGMILAWCAFLVGLVPTFYVIIHAGLTDDVLFLALPLPLLLVLPLLGNVPTRAGRPVYRQIEGLRRHMTKAVEHGSPEALEVFYRLAPYAIALGLGNAWSQRFAGQLAGIGAGTLTLLAATDVFINDLDRSSMHRSSSSSSDSSSGSSSDSGSSGSGSSGDGGGGGGGTGW